jgi:hypothetical protein
VVCGCGVPRSTNRSWTRKSNSSSRAECDWTMKDWQAAMDEIRKKQRACGWWVVGGGCVGGVRIGCSEIHKSELAKEIKFKRSSRAECEWNMKDGQAAMDEIQKSRCCGLGASNSTCERAWALQNECTRHAPCVWVVCGSGVLRSINRSWTRKSNSSVAAGLSVSGL